MNRRTVMAWAAVAPVALWTLIRLLSLEPGYPLTAALSYTPYVVPVAVLVAAFAGFLRQWIAFAAACAVALVLIAMVAPRAVGGPDEMEGRSLKVMSANVLVGRGQPEQVLELARERDVEILAFQELTPGFAADFEDAGGSELFPHSELELRKTVSGNGLYSRYPLRPIPYSLSRRAVVGAEASVPGAGALEVFSVHPQAPLGPDSNGTWLRELDSLPKADPGGVRRILLGDFNAGFDQPGFRSLVDGGYRDAAERMGDGLAPTWPAIAKPLKFLPVTIDHILFDERLGVRDFEVMEVPGSDHRAVFAELIVPAGN